MHACDFIKEKQNVKVRVDQRDKQALKTHFSDCSTQATSLEGVLPKAMLSLGDQWFVPLAPFCTGRKGAAEV